MMSRPSGRAANALRTVTLEPSVSLHAEGSCLAKFGNTHVLCTASIDERVPPFLRNSGKGWVTAEYGMLPRSTHSRIDREAARGKQGGRTLEIQRLIGLRPVPDQVDESRAGYVSLAVFQKAAVGLVSAALLGGQIYRSVEKA